MSTHEDFLQRHEEVLHHVGQLASIRGDDSQARGLVQEHLDALYTCLVEHFAAEEEGGYFGEVLEAHPEFERRIGRLGAQHAELLEQLEAATVEAKAEAMPQVRGTVGQLLDALRGHEAAERGLVQDATLQDVGAMD